jgi:hypothetical protein
VANTISCVVLEDSSLNLTNPPAVLLRPLQFASDMLDVNIEIRSALSVVLKFKKVETLALGKQTLK